jgi:glyoxylase-like metal-dependent hydrolase (beta-lactamase superfamily II)
VNCHIVYDTDSKEALVIDPGDESDLLVDIIQNDLEVNVKYIALTHAHFDHVGGIGDLKKATKGEVLLHKADESIYNEARSHAYSWGFQLDDLPGIDRFIVEGDTLQIGNFVLTVLHTPGHTEGGVCFYGNGIIFTGDTLFRDSVGRTDLPGGNIKALAASFRRLMALPPETRVYCGHGPETTIGREVTENFFSGDFL